MLNENRWSQDRWRDHVRVCRFQNFRNPDQPIVIELEQISSGMVDVQIACGDGKYIPVDPPMYKDWDAAQDAACRAIKHHFQSSRFAYFVMQFIPWQTTKECLPWFETDQKVIRTWLDKPDTRMGRAAVNDVLRLCGMRSIRGNRFAKDNDVFVLDPPAWEVAEQDGK